MRVLLLAEDDELYADGATPLREAGHEVVGCHEAGSTAGRWPCAGVDAECPLDHGIDVAVALQRETAPIEAGVGCVIRQKVPLVIGGGGTALPTADYAAAVVEGPGPSLVAAVEEAERAPLPDLSAAATEALSDLAARLELEGEPTAEVFRSRRTLRVVVHGPAAYDTAQRSSCGQTAFAVVRDAVPSNAVDMINVNFEPRD